jgi:L-aminopeptidase/D-esterase-like protein
MRNSHAIGGRRAGSSSCQRGRLALGRNATLAAHVFLNAGQPVGHVCCMTPQGLEGCRQPRQQQRAEAQQSVPRLLRHRSTAGTGRLLGMPPIELGPFGLLRLLCL